jgi:hypothetical protein
MPFVTPLSLCTPASLRPLSSPKRGAYYRAQAIGSALTPSIHPPLPVPLTRLLANLRFVYPQIPNIEIVTAPGCVYIVSTVEGGRQVVIHGQTFFQGFPGAAEGALRKIYRRTVREVRAKMKRVEDGGDIFGCVCGEEKCDCLTPTVTEEE